MDPYTSFKKLKQSERRDTDYHIERRIGSSGIAILSIHGGEIEPGTTRIADAIAGAGHSFYSFEGIKSGGNLALHITSTCFDEPSAMEIVCQSDIIVSIHGSARKEPVVHLGGLDVELKNRIRDKLRDAGFQITECSGPPFGGADHANICNLCGRGMGVQMEISRGLRSLMFRDLTPEGRKHQTKLFAEFTQAVREALEPFAAIYAETHPLDGTD
ncbi:MAG: poly-gamma-glutamate hydrolase family protein [Desulfobacterales bacterium]|jgi:phage replication-related protein YjqB (UPF0714/DUF867 family)|nr:poly-gamma-glutamate hydrolase family protein [Desulfobacterales bacterium]